MTTRADLRTRIRDELNDNAATKLWSDALLNGFVLDGLRDLGRRLPRHVQASITSVANQEAYTLAAPLAGAGVEIVGVEHPVGYHRTPFRFAGGDVEPSTDVVPSISPDVLSYDAWAGTLYLRPAPSDATAAIVVRARVPYTEPASDATVLDVATQDEDLVMLFGCARALTWIGADEAKRQRSGRERGADASTMRDHYRARYEAMMKARTSAVRSRRLVSR